MTLLDPVGACLTHLFVPLHAAQALRGARKLTRQHGFTAHASHTPLCFGAPAVTHDTLPSALARVPDAVVALSSAEHTDSSPEVPPRLLGAVATQAWRELVAWCGSHSTVSPAHLGVFVAATEFGDVQAEAVRCCTFESQAQADAETFGTPLPPEVVRCLPAAAAPSASVSTTASKSAAAAAGRGSKRRQGGRQQGGRKAGSKKRRRLKA